MDKLFVMFINIFYMLGSMLSTRDIGLKKIDKDFKSLYLLILWKRKNGLKKKNHKTVESVIRSNAPMPSHWNSILMALLGASLRLCVCTEAERGLL